MNSTGRWLARIGSLVIVVGFFLPAMAVSCTVDPTLGIGSLFGLPAVSGQLISLSLNDLAANPVAQGAILLYLVPIGAVVVLVLSLLAGQDENQEQNFLRGQIAGIAIGALAVIIAVASVYGQIQRLPLFTVSPDVGLFVLILGYGLVIAGIVMQYSERGAYAYQPPPPVGGPAPYRQPPRRAHRPPGPAAHMVPAWLITRSGREHQLRQGITRVGRSSRNDIVLVEDPTVSREHAKIVEENGHYRLVDLGGPGGTRLNGQRVRGQVILESDDEIQLGKDMVVRFVTTRR